jgi:uncharacterized membrane protein
MLFLGRFHPLLVHFPIALLLTAFVFELLSRSHRFRAMKFAVLPTLVIGSLSAVLSAITGYLISGEGGYDQSALVRHQWSGIGTAIVAVIATVVKWRMNAQSGFVATIFIVLIMLVVVTGHLGAGLTHGEDFLTEYAPWNDQQEDPFTLPAIANVDEAVMYADMVRPLLEQRCFACHSSRRQKGDLRLDTEEYILKGGENGNLLDGQSGELCRRIMLPLEHEDHMPPNERDQLSSAEIELLVAWVEEGADFAATVASMKSAPRIKAYWSILQSAQEEHWLPEESVSAGNAKAITALASAGVLVMPAATGNNYLSVNFLNAGSLRDVPEALRKLDKQIVELRADGMRVTDSLLVAIGSLQNLRKLSLANVTFAAESPQVTLHLPELQYLNLTGTPISESSLLQLADLPNLRKVYLYQTTVTKDAIARLAMASPTVEIDTGGYVLPVLVTDTLVWRRE